MQNDERKGVDEMRQYTPTTEDLLDENSDNLILVPARYTVRVQIDNGDWRLVAACPTTHSMMETAHYWRASGHIVQVRQANGRMVE